MNDIIFNIKPGMICWKETSKEYKKKYRVYEKEKEKENNIQQKKEIKLVENNIQQKKENNIQQKKEIKLVEKKIQQKKDNKLVKKKIQQKRDNKLVKKRESKLDELILKCDEFNKDTVYKVVKSKEPLYSIVMLNWLRWSTFMDTIDHISKNQITPINMCITSQENTNKKYQKQLLEKMKYFNDSNIVFTDKNEGSGPPRHKTLHRALKKWNTPYIHFTDDDMRLPKYSVELMISLMEDYPEIGAVNIKTLPRSNIWGINKKNQLYHYKPKEVFNYSKSLGSATLVVRREVFDTCDYDPKYIIGCGDIDFGLQMNKAGWKMVMLDIPGLWAENIQKNNTSNYSKSRYNRKTIKNSIKIFKKKWGYVI